MFCFWSNLFIGIFDVIMLIFFFVVVVIVFLVFIIFVFVLLIVFFVDYFFGEIFCVGFKCFSGLNIIEIEGCVFIES